MRLTLPRCFRQPIVQGLALVAVIGCQKQATIVPTSKAKAQAEASAVAKKRNQQEADELLSSVVSILQSTTESHIYPTVLRQLNQFVQRRSEAIGTISADANQAFVQFFGSDSLSQIESKAFDAADAEYLAHSFFLRAVTAGITRGQEPPVATASRLFEWVTRHVQYVPAGSQVEGPPVEIALRGTGDASERSWIFVELLRQAGLTGCVIGVPGPSQQLIIPWLCGVIVEDEIHLFDPILGLPVFDREHKVATLRQLAQEPALIDQLVADTNLVPQRASLTKSFTLLLALEPRMVAPRMEFLQSQLVGEVRTNLFVDVPAVMRTALAAMTKVPDSQGTRIWRFPMILREQMLDGPTRGRLHASMNLVWLYSPESARVQQLQGNHEKAIERLGGMFMDDMSPAALDAFLSQKGIVPEIRRATVMRGPRDIPYFLGLSKLEQGRPQPAVAREWFGRYLDRYGSMFLQDEDILDWGELATALVNQTGGPAKRIWELLDPKVQADVKVIADLQARMNEERRKLASQIPSGLVLRVRAEPAIRNRIREGLNAQLRRSDFHQAEAFAKVALSDSTKALVKEAARSEDATVRANRALLDDAFPNFIVRRSALWEAGASRQMGVAFFDEGKTTEAVDWLRKPRPDLAPVDQAALWALARIYAWKTGAGT